MDLANLFTSHIRKEYQNFLWSGDPRTQHLFGVRTPWFTLTSIVLYLLTVLKIGPNFMKNKKPFQLQHIIVTYNILIMAGNAYIFWIAATYGWFDKYNWICEPMNFSSSPNDIMVVNVCYLYFITKFIEFLDTIFFVLKKKKRQLSCLHIYHHAIMPFNVYLGLKFSTTGHFTFFIMLNSFIHVIMYLYYGLAACGTKFQKFLWWKKYVTVMQLIQFVIIGVHSAITFYNGCNLSKPLLWILMANSVIFFILFSKFYIRNYNAKVERKK